MPRLNWTLPLPVTENLLEVMPLSALLHPQVSACHAISEQTWALGSLATRSSCLLSRLLALRNLITALSLDSLLFCPVYGPRFKPRMTCFTEFQKQVLDRLTDLYPNTDFFFFLAQKHSLKTDLVRAYPELSQESWFLVTVVTPQTDLWDGIVQMAGPRRV